MFSGLEAPSHWVIVALAVIALFGYRRLPDAARSVGRSLRIFKTELKGMSEDDQRSTAAIAPPANEPVASSTDTAAKPNEASVSFAVSSSAAQGRRPDASHDS